MPASIISLSKTEVYEEIPGLQSGAFAIPVSDGKPNILLITDSFYYKPDIEGNQDRVVVPANTIATSIVQMHLSSQLAYKLGQHPAVFAVLDELVSADVVMAKYKRQVDEALTAQKAWFIALVRMADDDWQVAHRHNMISDTQRTAARQLMLEREWLDTLKTAEEHKADQCPFCGTGLLNKDAPICPTCGKVHNPAKLMELEKKFGTAAVKA